MDLFKRGLVVLVGGLVILVLYRDYKITKLHNAVVADYNELTEEIAKAHDTTDSTGDDVEYWKNKYNEAASLYNATWDELNAYREIAMRNAQSSFINITVPELQKDTIGYIYIPTCGVSAYIRYGSDDVAISNFHVGEFEVSEDIGVGNYSVCGHANELKKYVFSNLYDIEIGDPIYIYKNGTIYKFSADYVRTVAPEDTWILDHTDTPTCTIMCCVDEGKNRFVVFGNLVMTDEVDNSEKE